MIARQAGLSTEEVVKVTASLPLLFQPGAQWYYGANMLVLGRLVEVVSGMRFGDFLKDCVFEPLSMCDTDFYVSPDKLPRFAQIYDVDEVEGLMVAGTCPRSHHKVEHYSAASYVGRPRLETGDGGLISTAADLIRFFQMLLNGGMLDGPPHFKPHNRASNAFESFAARIRTDSAGEPRAPCDRTKRLWLRVYNGGRDQSFGTWIGGVCW